MKKVLILLSFLGLVILPVMPILQLAGIGSAGHTKCGLAIGTLLWFTTAPFWLKGKTAND
jgi:hypothetical protein